MRKLADQAGYPLSVYVRVRSLRPLQAPRLQPKPQPNPELLRELRRIGVNLNQLARAANAGHPVDGDALEKTLDGINQAVADLYS